MAACELPLIVGVPCRYCPVVRVVDCGFARADRRQFIAIPWRVGCASVRVKDGWCLCCCVAAWMACMPYHPWPTPRWPSLRPTLAQPVLKSGLALPGSGFAPAPGAEADCLTLSGWRAVVLPDGGLAQHQSQPFSGAGRDGAGHGRHQRQQHRLDGPAGQPVGRPAGCQFAANAPWPCMGLV